MKYGSVQRLISQAVASSLVRLLPLRSTIKANKRAQTLIQTVLASLLPVAITTTGVWSVGYSNQSQIDWRSTGEAPSEAMDCVEGG